MLYLSKTKIYQSSWHYGPLMNHLVIQSSTQYGSPWTIESFSHALFNILLSFTIIYHKFIIISNSRLNLVIRKIAPRKIVYSVWWYSMVSTLDGIRNSRHNPVIRLSSLRKIVYFIQWCLWLQQLMASCLLLSYSFSAYFYSSMNLLHCFVENISCKCIHPFLPL